MPRRLECLPFSTEALYVEIQRACGASWPPEHESRPHQVNYLASYLGHPEAGAKTILVEAPYTDRHYVEEYGRYYANALRPPSHETTRLHFFRSVLTDESLVEALAAASTGKQSFEERQVALQESYLGFVVVRPLASVPIGRTVLATYGNAQASRCYAPAGTKHRVHLLGFELVVRGVPFQQQDMAVGACATTALWSALARVCRADGGRAPTPFAVTAAATQSLLSDRDFPASAGLSIEQMMAAIRALGYTPYLLKPAMAPEAFQIAIKTYLSSGIPVILISADIPAHAVTAVGYREEPKEEEEGEEVPLVRIPGEKLLSVPGLSRIYIHDDRVGPYARAKWHPPIEDGYAPRLVFDPYSQPFVAWEKDTAEVWRAVVPLYPKLRLSASDLIRTAGEMQSLVRYVLPSEVSDPIIDLRFCLGGEYLNELLLSGAAKDRILQFIRDATLSRYVGIVRFVCEGSKMVDFVCDTTDIARSYPEYSTVIAVFVYPDSYVEQFQAFAKDHFPNVLVC